MDVLKAFENAGFQQAEIVNPNYAGGKVVVKIMTANGWTYEKITPANCETEVAAWATNRKPYPGEA
jgi:hypothetical protein